MSKKEKLIKRLKSRPKDFEFDMSNLLTYKVSAILLAGCGVTYSNDETSYNNRRVKKLLRKTQL